MEYRHQPVMLREVLEYLAPQPGQEFIDCTLGGAGYTLALAERIGPEGKLVAIDCDAAAIENAKQRTAEKKLSNLVLVQDNFKNLDSIISANFPEGKKFDGLVFDLGLSSYQLEDESRGFSFKGDRPLDMAFGPGEGEGTADILNSYPLLELTRIFREYGEERRAYQIAKAIVNERRQKKLETTADLVAVIERTVPTRFYAKIHPATRIFQALRMETNSELEALTAALPQAMAHLKPGGRLVVVSFHSGEDRIVKRFLKDNPEAKILTKKPLVPSAEEAASNPRARSAKLRAAEKGN